MKEQDVYKRLRRELSEEFTIHSEDIANIINYLKDQGILDYDNLKEYFSEQDEED